MWRTTCRIVVYTYDDVCGLTRKAITDLVLESKTIIGSA
jgi:hypothetical protein